MPYIRIDEIDLRKIADSDVEIKYMYTEKLLDYEGNIDELKKLLQRKWKQNGNTLKIMNRRNRKRY